MDRTSIIADIARTLFLCAYADGIENGALVGSSPGPGEKWDDYAPDTDPAAQRKAESLVAQWESDMCGTRKIEQACAQWLTLGGPSAERFANAWAMQALEHGIGLADDLPSPYEYPDWMCPPHCSFYTWDLDMANIS